LSDKTVLSSCVVRPEAIPIPINARTIAKAASTAQAVPFELVVEWVSTMFVLVPEGLCKQERETGPEGVHPGRGLAKNTNHFTINRDLGDMKSERIGGISDCSSWPCCHLAAQEASIGIPINQGWMPITAPDADRCGEEDD
jgi:hypothetical protein